VEMKHPGVWVMGHLADNDGGTAWASSLNTPVPRDTAMHEAQAVPLELHAPRQGECDAGRADETIEMTIVK